MIRALLHAVCIAAAAACSRAAQPPAGAEAAAAPATQFLRFTEEGAYLGRLDLAITSYANAEGARVDLVAATHIGERAYYEALRERFSAYDAVLYELVAPAGHRPTPDEHRNADNPVSRLQRALQNALDLEFQLDGIDYQQPNFVHADLSPVELAEQWRKSGETFGRLLLRALATAMGQAKKQAERGEVDTTGPELLAALLSAHATQRLRFLLARQLLELEESFSMFGNPDSGLGRVLLGSRNERAIEVLRQELARGRTKVAIFYGCAHMPDLEQRLLALGFSRKGQEWVTAWRSGDKPLQTMGEKRPSKGADPGGGKTPR
jgi:hypothetical protein